MKKSLLIEDTGSRFKINHNEQFNQQYAKMYFARLNTLKPDAIAAAKSKWADLTPAQFLSEVGNAVLGHECVIVGTLYKNMSLKPSALHAVEKDEPYIPFSNYTSNNDELVIEDCSSRIVLSSSVLIPADVCTGYVMALRGKVVEGPKFHVVDFCFPSLSCTQSLPATAGARISDATLTSERPLLAVVAGLSIASAATPPLYTSFLQDFLQGRIVAHERSRAFASRISRLIVAGDALSWERAEPLYPPVRNEVMKSKAEKAREIEEESASLETVDLFLSTLCSTVGIELMPGGGDPCSTLLPQQPIHPFLLPMTRSQGRERVMARTNPFEFTCRDSTKSGKSPKFVVIAQSLDDVLKFSRRGIRPVDALELMVRGRLLAPTAPDTLNCLPFVDKDPFVISEGTTVVIASCLSAKQAEWKVVHEIGEEGKGCVLCIVCPSYAKTGSVVVVDPVSLEVDVVSADFSRLGTIFAEKSADDEEREREELARLNVVDIEMGEDE
eukprot:GDKJ01028145.1.p1 GENE.GDKJ01028145.1~~GDKJ01028145.1.p1  ORF type:complete len:534 (-),score=107.89 GDKJ01028145.1:85-1581(-)